jgi:8-oxo-dGTP pyrophosphatase MutT (NUDIX family)
MTIDKTAIRNAATVIVVRDRNSQPSILMGQRGSRAAFMPNKFVFPGGAVDAADFGVPLAEPLPQPCASRVTEELREDTPATISSALPVAAVRELWEETGMILGAPGNWAVPPAQDWETFAETGHVPTARGLSFVFRAITPPGRPRRFDARFFLLDADELTGDLDDFSRASDELSHLQWIPLDQARGFDLPFITEVVLAEVEGRLTESDVPSAVPFFKNTDEAACFKRIYGRAPSKADLGG